MSSRKVTLEESIARLAFETGASPSFVEKVRALFLGRGIDLEDSSEPYATALSEAFQRHAAIRHRIDEARESLARLHANLAEMGSVFQDHLVRLRTLREKLTGGSAEGSRASDERMRLVPGDHDRTVVPGPEGVQ
ncbi:MAG TPA: hypothetical protein VFB67_08175 [Candidatus Polarisedimenticolaceae bacterium]|nr:hypothetical protein [Candidatus Polarisedimenticolaceae bacterium]